jgi:RHS repeat-associated protein
LTLAETRGFIGERYDEAAGLQYLNARYYDPRLGMFTQPDWWEVTWPGVGTNRYSYSFNDPVNGSDPGGHWVAPDGIYVDTGDADLYPGFAFDPTKNYAEVGVMAAITAGGVAVTPGIALGVASRYPGAYAFGMEIAMGEIGMTVGIAGAGGATVVGKWARVTESMSARAAAYQKFATGTSAGKSLVVGGAKFDGVTKAGHLLDAKGPGYSGFVEYGKFKDWWSGADELLDQARRQIRAAKGAKIE